MPTFQKNISPAAGNNHFGKNGAFVFLILWALVFCLYYPAANAGFVADFTGWLDQVKNHSFLENLNRTNYQVRSMYQFTQLVTYLFYKLFGTHTWLWHLLFVTLHSINAWLLYTLVFRLLDDVKVAGSKAISFTGTVLFCMSPYISEVVVWEPSFHYLPGLLMMLLVLIWTQSYARTGERKYALWAGIIYFLSTFALEIFYITPWLLLVLAFYYRWQPTYGKKVFAGIVQYFFLPALLLFIAHLVEYRLFYGTWIAHISAGNSVAISIASWGKPAKYLFHLLFLGRFFAHDKKHIVYAFCDSIAGVVIVYGIALAGFCYIIVRFRNMTGKGKVVSLLFAWMSITLLLLVPLWFQDLLLVLQDRYVYFTAAFFYMIAALLVSAISMRYLQVGIICLFGLVNLRFTILVSRYWGKSEKVVHGLLYNIPDERNRTIILLNLPQSMHGVAMIGAEPESEYKLMHDLLLPEKALKTKVYDAMAYNMETPGDGAHATVLNDSTVKVTLNQWGTWWWYEAKGGHSYENSDYRLNLTDAGHEYILTLKKPAQKYLLLCQIGDQWKEVNWSTR